MKHTPGPWKLGEEKISNVGVIEIDINQDVAGYAPFIAKAYGSTNPMIDWDAGARHVHANALLIAAVPELFVVLKKAEQQLKFVNNGDFDCEELLAEINDVINKATGE